MKFKLEQTKTGDGTKGWIVAGEYGMVVTFNEGGFAKTFIPTYAEALKKLELARKVEREKNKPIPVHKSKLIKSKTGKVFNRNSHRRSRPK